MIEFEEDPVTIACHNDAVPSDYQPRFIGSGTFVVDFRTGHSFEKKHAIDDETRDASEAFNRMAEASRVGGIGTLRGTGTSLIAVGRFSSDGLALIKPSWNEGKKLKTLQFGEYAIVGPTDEGYEDLSSVADTKGGTVAGLTESEIDVLSYYLDHFEERGRLRSPVR